MRTQLLSDVLWQREGQTSLEHFRLSRRPDGFALEGVIVSWEGAPRHVHYRVLCDPEWRSRSAQVTMVEREDVRRLELERDRTGKWRRDGNALADFADIVDLDLEVTPSTNTLPIRRLSLDVGESADTDALWIRFPDLTLERLPQRYTRTAEDRYRYESHGGTFGADLEVDREGVVIRYDALWRRIQSQPVQR